MISLELLNKLDKEVDKLLENETSESLTKWLLGKRNKSASKILSNGKIVNMKSKNDSLFLRYKNGNFNTPKSNDSFPPDNKCAA
jgi:hypothetical protein